MVSGSYGRKRAFAYRLPSAKVEGLQQNLNTGFEQLIADMLDVRAEGIRNRKDIEFLWAFHDAIVATYGFQLLHVADADAMIMKNYLYANGKLHDMLGDLHREGPSDPFADDALFRG